MRITISGLPGSGTTTIANSLASELNYKLISAGEVFRELARSRGQSLENFSKIAEQDPEIDQYIDKLQKEKAEKEENVVVEGRLSGWMINNALKVFIFANPEVRYARIAGRENKDVKIAREETIRREEYERRRYTKFYGINYDDWSIYNLVIDSGCFEAKKIVKIIKWAVELK